MATKAELAQALAAVQQVLASPAFLALMPAFEDMAADRALLEACIADPMGVLRTRGVPVPPAIERIEVRGRHTPREAIRRGLRGGNMEWRFYVRCGTGSWRVVFLCDAWPLDAPAEVPDPPAYT